MVDLYHKKDGFQNCAKGKMGRVGICGSILVVEEILGKARLEGKEGRKVVFGAERRLEAVWSGDLLMVHHIRYAKILRMSNDAKGAINVLQGAMGPERPHHFVQADMVGRSHGTYYSIAGGCHVFLGNIEKAQVMFDKILDLIDKKKISGKNLPTEVYIKKKPDGCVEVASYKEKQVRRGGDVEKFAEATKINPAEATNLTHDRRNAHRRMGVALTSRIHPFPTHHASHYHKPPSPTSPSSVKLRESKLSLEFKPSTPISSLSNLDPHSHYDLDTHDELAVRSLLMGVNHRASRYFVPSRAFLEDAHARHAHVKINTWVGGVAVFELAVLDLKEVEARDRAESVGYSPSSSSVSVASSTTLLPCVEGGGDGRGKAGGLEICS
ncbi:hypothetical protein K443DRAFT_121801 [Laccaria amethystina LaAM-08-1]|uniref:Uncharacterized protein n=1 Tax=Laccaria amethystina LaAM-08-1 TaxID=1095629 RepID=A0A0C9XYJ5_9AGAR|nr:hypothetical protein K443DRAFT_121801 [Laccaria amethystina LaAM-08-1]